MLYIPPTRDADRYRFECSQLCEERRWPVAAITGDPEAARRMVVTGAACRVVVARPAHARAVALEVEVASNPRRAGGGPGRPRRLS